MTYNQLKKWIAKPENSDGIMKFLLKRGFRKTSELENLPFLERFFILLGFFEEKTGTSAI